MKKYTIWFVSGTNEKSTQANSCSSRKGLLHGECEFVYAGWPTYRACYSYWTSLSDEDTRRSNVFLVSRK